MFSCRWTKARRPGEVVLDVQNVTMHNAQHKKDAVKNVSFPGAWR